MNSNTISNTQLLGGRRGRRPYNYNPNNRRPRRRPQPRYYGGGGRRRQQPRRGFRPLRWAARNFGRFVPGLRRITDKIFPVIPNNEPRDLRGVQINRNIITKTGLPKLGPDGNGNRINHSEVLKMLDAYNGGTVAEYKLNPGSKKCLPWLSSMANSYDTYKVNSISVRFVSAAPTTLTGKLYIYFDRDVLDDVAPTEIAFSQMDSCLQTPLWQNVVLNVDVSDIPILYMRDDTLSLVNKDAKTYDLGKICTMLVASADTPKVGTLWIDYDVTLYRPSQSTVTTFTELQFDTPSIESVVGLGVNKSLGTNPFKEELPGSASSLTVENYFRGFIDVEIVGTVLTNIELNFGIETHGSSVIDSGLLFLNSTTTGRRRFTVELFPDDELQIAITATTVTSTLLHLVDIPYTGLIDESQYH